MRKDADSGAAERTMRPSPERSAGTAEPKPRPLPQRAAEGAGLRARQYPKRAPSAPEFPGCRPMPLLRCDLDTHDGRFEYWDGDSGIAWVCEPTSPAHESASQRLAGLSQVIAGVRGSAIECYGTMDLLMRDAYGERRRILQADQTLYLCPPRAELLDAGAMVVGEHHYPDVVLEVDHRTDVRRGKLGLYRGVGLPGGVGGGAGGRLVESSGGAAAGGHDSSARRGGVPDGGGEPGLSGMESGGDPRRLERSEDVEGDRRGPEPGGPGVGGPTRHGARRHALAAHATSGGACRDDRSLCPRDSGFAGDLRIRIAARCRGVGRIERPSRRRRRAAVRRRIGLPGPASRPPALRLRPGDAPARLPGRRRRG